MKYTNMKRFCTGLVLVALIACICVPAGAAAQQYFVNDGRQTISGALGDCYVTGRSGMTQLGTDAPYVMTASGLTQLGEAQPTVQRQPQSLSVTGTVPVAHDTVRVGLYYYYSDARDTSLTSANLQNYAGRGYAFGYYDDSRNFCQLGTTGETKLTMAIDKNVDLSGGHVGCYHIRLSGSYADFDSASAAAAAYTDGFPAYYNGTYYVLLGSYDTSADADAAASTRGVNGSAYSASNRCIVVTRTSDARILFEFDCGTDRSLAVRPLNSGGKAETWFKGYRYYGDFEYLRYNGGKLTVVNVLPLEDYIKGVIPYEMNGSWPLEALKAQAMCARTYVAANFDAYSRYGFDVTCDTYSQAYRGTVSATETSNRAVDETANKFITYNGSLVTALYFSSDGGGTEDSENVFYNAYPYLRGTADPYEQAAASINSYSQWTRTWSKADIAGRLARSGRSIPDVERIEVQYSDFGNAVGMTFVSASGKTVSVTQSSCYTFACYSSGLGLPSIHFTMQDNGSSVTFTGGGWGHNVGMSQFGAYAMADAYGYRYDQILSFYYEGVGLAEGIFSE